MLVILKLVMGVSVNQPERVTSPLVAVAPIGENSGRAFVGEGLKLTCRQEQCELAGEAVV
jgi:hypothetical protein